MMLNRDWKWNLLICFLATFVCKAYGNWNTCRNDYSMHNDFPSRCDLTCEGYPVSIICPGTDVIKILSAEYGRQSAHECVGLRSEMANTNCVLPEAKDIVSDLCNNKTVCNFKLAGNLFPDPCPGTKKYLKTKYDCVKYMFGCPGTLVGIGHEELSSIAVQPNPGAWTKDPLLRENVFFAPSGDVVHEYSNWRDFIEGSPTKRYNLPSNMASGNIVVYDRNLYYIKDGSNHIIRYSFITESRTKEARLPVPESETSDLGDISLAVDENGLWVTYPAIGGLITIGLLDKDLLTISKTWPTALRNVDSLHTFFICGVMYSVNPISGTINYSFNTNSKSGQEVKNILIPFDHDRLTGRRSFMRYNASFLSYNPRDRLLYSWDEKNSNAIYYKLHFEKEVRPTKDDTPKSSKSTTTRSSRRKPMKSTISTRVRIRTTSKIPSRSQPSRTPNIPRNFCHSKRHRNILWPPTKAGDIARVDCGDGTGGFATWRCKVISPTLDPEWDPVGPDLSRCVTWLSDIGSMYDRGIIDRSFSFERLSSEVAKRRNELTGKLVELISKLVDKFLEDPTLPSKDDGRGIVESVARIFSMLLEKKEAWERFNEEQSTGIANSLMKSLQKAAFLYADAVSIAPEEYSDKAVLRVTTDEILMQIEVRDKSLRSLMFETETTFPDEVICSEKMNQCGSNVINVPDDVIVRQIGRGSSPTVIFALYSRLGTFLAPSDRLGWKIDSKILSATLRHPTPRLHKPRPVRITLEHNAPSNLPRRCMQWIDSTSSDAGNWTDVGCRVKFSNDTHTHCSCNKPATLAVFVDKSSVKVDPARDMTLEIVTSVGIAIAIVCLIACCVTFSVFKNIQNDRSNILKNLCFCLLAAEVVFLVGINQTGNNIFCSTVAGFLHYFFLATFMWMALEGFQLYFMLTELFEEDSRRKWYYMTGYGIPAVTVAVTAAVGHRSYGTSRGCFIDPQSEIIWGIIAPLFALILAKVGPLFATMYKIHKSTLAFADSPKITIVRCYLRGAFILLALEILTWVFAILWVNERSVVLACLFCIFNAVQGIFMLVFHCWTPPEIRQEYARMFERFPCCKKLSKESYVANSMTFSKHYGPGRFTPTGTNTANIQPSLGRQSRPWVSAVTLPKTVDSPPISPFSVNATEKREKPGPNQRPQMEQPTHFTINPGYEQRRYQEEEVFLPPTYEPTQLQNNLMPAPQNEIPYNRLQHHRHSEFYPNELHFEMAPILPPARYRTGVAPAPRRHNRANTMAQGCAIRTNPHFGPSSQSQPRVHDVVCHRHPSAPENGPFYWELDPPFLRVRDCPPPHVESDSGMSIHNLPPNSIIQRLRNEMQQPPADPDRQFKPVIDNSNHVYSHSPSPPIRIRVSPTREHAKKILHNQKLEANISEDEGQGSSFEDQENLNICNHSDAAASRCARHSETSIISPSQTHGKLDANNGRMRRSVNSDSDDPIATDCSRSSDGSSFERQYRWSNQEMLV